MTYIKASTDDMHSTAGVLQNAAGILSDIGKRIQSIDIDPRLYDGQLAEKIMPILEGFSNQFQSFSDKLSIHGILLDQFAVDTDAFFANTHSSVLRISGVNIENSKFLSSLVLFSSMKQQVIHNPHFIPLSILPSTIKPSKNQVGLNIWNGDTYDNNIHLYNRGGNIAFSDNKILGFSAHNVPAKSKENMFPRKGYDEKTNSNCTWYVSEAVYYISGGRINLSRLGWSGAYNWVSAAKKDKTGIVQTKVTNEGITIARIESVPEPGCLYKIGGHIALVEEVIWKDENGIKKWEIVVSEENAGTEEKPDNAGLPIEKDKSVDVGIEGVKRYRRTISQESGGEFIYINYDYGTQNTW